MDIRFSDEENAFRAEVRAFLQQAWTPELAARIDDDATLPAGHRRMAAAPVRTRLGRARLAQAPTAAANGRPTQRYIYDVERSAIGAPDVLPFGMKMVGPVIIKYGNDEQKAALPAAHPARAGLVVPGLFGARRRLRPGGAEDPRRTRR